MTAQTETPTQDERIMAALSHVSILFIFFGLIAPIYLWVTQREKSAYVRFQALQAIAFQLSLIFTFILGMGCYICSIPTVMFSTVLIGSLQTSNTNPSPLFMFPFVAPFFVIGSVMLLQVAFIIYGVVAAALTIQGKDFRYLIIGRRVEQFLAGK